MPIHKRDRNFQNIVNELDIKTIPTEYIQQLNLICENGEKIYFNGEQIKDFPGSDLVEGLIHFVEDNSDLQTPVVDVEIIIDYVQLEKDISITDKDPTDNLVKLMVLEEEIEYYKTLLQPHDTGHIHTTISFLKNRIQNIKGEHDEWPFV